MAEGTLGDDGGQEWALAPGWQPDPATPGLLRYWTGDRWTGRTRPEPSAVPSGASRPAPVGLARAGGGLDPYGPADGAEDEDVDGWATVGPRRSRRARRAAAVLAALLVVALVGAAVVPVVEGGGEPAPTRLRVLGLAGYRPLQVAGVAVAAGRPWGVPCAPVAIRVGGTVPAAFGSHLAAAAAAARAEGIAVHLVLAGAPGVGPVVDVVAVDAAGTGRTGPLRLSATGVHRRGARAPQLRRVTAAVRLVGPGVPRQGLVARRVVAAAAGLAGSSAPGSGIDAAGGAGRFSAGDLAAMARMSGCTPVRPAVA